MKRSVGLLIVGVLLTACVVGAEKGDTKEAKKPPKDRVVAMYFHRTQRCPTCLKMGSYTEEAIKTGFARQLKDRTVELHYIDFQDKKNAAYAKAYKISGPALIVARVANGKVAEFKDLKEIWTNVNDKKAFAKYVQSQIAAYGKKKE